MPATADQLAEIRSQIPEEWTPTVHFDDTAVHAVFDRVGTVSKTILDRARKKLALALESPETFSIAGEYSQSAGAGLAGLRGLVKTWEATVAEEDKAADGAYSLALAPTYRLNPPGR